MSRIHIAVIIDNINSMYNMSIVTWTYKKTVKIYKLRMNLFDEFTMQQEQPHIQTTNTIDK